MGYESTERTVGYGTGSTVISVEEYVVDDIDSELKQIITLILEIYEEIYEDVKVIDDMQSKFLDVICDEVTKVRDALDDLVEMVESLKISNIDIYNQIMALDKEIRSQL